MIHYNILVDVTVPQVPSILKKHHNEKLYLLRNDLHCSRNLSTGKIIWPSQCVLVVASHSNTIRGLDSSHTKPDPIYSHI
jgi:hypothetical protein